MAQLDEYKALKEKKEYFLFGEDQITSDLGKLFENLDKSQSKKEFLFRGSTEAKYMMYSSAQRYYIENDMQVGEPSKEIARYNEFVSELIEQTKKWNNGSVEKLLNANNILPSNILAYLGFMQHYHIPTPYLDFTHNPYVALYFAAGTKAFAPSLNEIDNYFSLYFVDLSNMSFEGWKQAFKALNSKAETTGISYNEMSNTQLHILTEDNKAYRLLNNTNIINQEGAFIYNAYPDVPLELVYFNFIQEMKQRLLAKAAPIHPDLIKEFGDASIFTNRLFLR